ncbi:MAG: hypothetical protein V9G13_06650 [Marmoricola sp.]
MVEQLGQYQPLHEVKRKTTGIYARSLHQDYFGEWNFNLNWKPIGSFKAYAGLDPHDPLWAAPDRQWPGDQRTGSDDLLREIWQLHLMINTRMPTQPMSCSTWNRCGAGSGASHTRSRCT